MKVQNMSPKESGFSQVPAGDGAAVARRTAGGGSTATWLALGASNLTLLLPHLVREAPSIRLKIRAGHGRALTRPSRFLIRALPASLLGLERPQAHRARFAVAPQNQTPADRIECVLVMDLGLDLLYGATVSEVSAGLDRLFEQHPAARTVVVRPPVSTVEGLSPLRFELFRRMFFPGHAVERTALLEALGGLDGELRERADRGQVQALAMPDSWLAADAIHLRRPHRGHAARWLLHALAGGLSSGREAADVDQEAAQARDVAPGDVARRFVLLRLRAWPAQFSLGPWALSRRQPCLAKGAFELWLE
jgi:hypothetical protein